MKNENNMMHGRDWDGQMSLEGFHLTEKLNDVRAYWDGLRFWSRGGNPIQVPRRISTKMPQGVEVDGGFFAKNDFQAASQAVRNNAWMHTVNFLAFDAPMYLGFWEERIDRLAGVCELIVPRFGVCHSNSQAVDVMYEVCGLGGEGIMAYHPSRGYEAGRCDSVVKLKPSIASHLPSWIEDFIK